jgi:UDP-N-acetylmuramyl pentapeptide phosphotransferase/UDP-N-acetylglucosamine-1-phosphate transferase
MSFLLSFLLSSILTVALTSSLLRLFSGEFWLKENYRKELVSCSGGPLITLFSLTSLALLTPIVYFFGKGVIDFQNLYAFAALIFGLGLLGWLDDLGGSSQRRGFKGHFGALLKGEITTGAIKTFGVGALSLLVSTSFSETWYSVVLNTLIIALSANFFNLLDVRPGRASKFFLLFSAGLLVWFWQEPLRVEHLQPLWLVWGSIFGVIVVLLWYDLKGKLMLGDSGSNLIGGVLGFSFALSSFNLIYKVVAITFLVVMHIIAEFSSISLLFEKIYPLRLFDRWGRME